MNNIPKISKKEYPGLYQAADDASTNAQSNYITIIGIDLSAMIIAAALAIYNYQNTESKQLLYIVSALFILLSLILTIVVLTKKYEDVWYQGRALAESCKTLTWRFITCSELFENNLSEAEARSKFIERLSDLSKEFTELNKALNSKVASLPVIPDLLLQLRRLSVSDRKDYYIKNRI